MSRNNCYGLVLSLVFGVSLSGRASSQLPTANTSLATSSTLLVPAGTTVQLAVTRPVLARTAKPGDTLYAQTIFPVVLNGSVRLPAGTYVLATIDAVTKPTRKLQQATMRLELTKLILSNGYTVLFDPHSAKAPPPISDLTIKVSTANDLLLDNGAQLEFTFSAALSLDAAMVAKAVPLSRPPAPGSFRTATMCRGTPGFPGTPGLPGTADTVIPGAPGTPATVIPGSNGSPDTVIPGIPATPSTVIPGSPGTAGTPDTPATVCPAPPLVVSSQPESSPSVTLTHTP